MTRIITARVDVIRNGVKYNELAIHDKLQTPKIIMATDALIKMSMTGHFVHNDDVDYLSDHIKPYLIIDGV